MVISMKNITKICLPLIAVILTTISCLQAVAQTIYEYYGISYVIVTNTEVTVVGWDNRSSVLQIPNQINGRNVISISNGAFESNAVLASVDFSKSNSLKRIGAYAFQDCVGLNEPLVLTESITAIENRAFQNCSTLPSVTVNSHISVIPNQCFMGCSSLKKAQLTEGIESINAWAFADCNLLEYINIPKSVSFISDYAFSGDNNLTFGVWYGTYGYEYAKEQNIPYILLDEVKLGDANGDGAVNINDVTAVQRNLAELDTLEGIFLHAADVNQDGTVDIADATAIQMYLAEYEMDYPIGEIMTQ